MLYFWSANGCVDFAKSSLDIFAWPGMVISLVTFRNLLAKRSGNQRYCWLISRLERNQIVGDKRKIEFNSVTSYRKILEQSFEIRICKKRCIEKQTYPHFRIVSLTWNLIYLVKLTCEIVQYIVILVWIS